MVFTEITNKYRPNSIEYIEFVGFNRSKQNPEGYGAGEQHLYRHEYDGDKIKSTVPEFLSVNTTEDLMADIRITVV